MIPNILTIVNAFEKLNDVILYTSHIKHIKDQYYLMKIFGKKNDQKCKHIYAESYIRNIHFPRTKILQTKYTRSRWTIKFDIWKMKDVQH